MKALRIIRSALPFFLVVALVSACLFYPGGHETQAAQRVVRVWNVDTFEGGKGSRTSFLKSVARRVEKKREGVCFLVLSLTPEGARQCCLEGDVPDLLSFGVGLSEFAERSLPLPYSFCGGELGGDTLAYPWCAGQYYLFSLTDDFEAEGEVAVSCGGSNLPQVAAALAGITGEELPSLTAYTAFLGGKYRYLLGTQRDVCRFAARDVPVYRKPLRGYSDLYQYLSVLSEEKEEDCLAFLEELRSPEVRGSLSSLGMFAPEETEAECTASVFLSAEGRETLSQAAREGKNLEKFLKKT